MSNSTTVTVGDIRELRGEGLAEEEVWSLLCQAVQTLQDLFLSDEINQENILPVLTPQNLEIGSKGRIVISYVTEVGEGDEQFLAPEYATGKNGRSSDTFDWEKMWVYSLGKALESSVKAKPGVRPSSLDFVLGFMTKEDPSQRASLMALFNVISERCKTTLPSKPFSHLVMDMYREVFGTPIQCLSPRSSLKGFPRSREERTSSPEESITPTLASLPRKSPEVRRNPVQRAPSRLYRGPSKTEDSFQITVKCIGPEFVVRGPEPPKVVSVGEAKTWQGRTVTVVLLTGARIRIACDPQLVTVGKIFETVVQSEQLEDNYIFGLACLMNGDFVFLPAETKVHKLAGWKKSSERSGNFLLFLRVKFFLPNLRGIRNSTTKHLLYLQLRRSLIDQQVKCDLKNLLTLGGLALQAEFGDYADQEHGSFSYFLLEHYLPEEVIEEREELEKQLQDLHKSRVGLDPGRAEEIFIAQAQRLPEYGSHHYTGQWVRKAGKIPMWVTINPEGVNLYEKKKSVQERKVHEAFAWKNIQNLKWNEQYLYIVPNDVGKQKLRSYKIKMDNKKSFYFFRLASFHHQFFLKLRVELSSLHSLSLEFGVAVTKKEETEEKENLRNRNREWIRRREEYRERRSTDKENENPRRREKRRGVKMGVRAFDAVGRRLSVSTEASNSSSDAYVLDASIKSAEEGFRYDPQETLPSALAEKLENVSWERERMLRKVRLVKDKYGSFGLEVAEGENGGVFVENVLKAKATEDVKRGDQLIAVNGLCLLSLSYADALNLLKSAGNEMEILVSQTCGTDSRQKPAEMEYLKNIRYDTALEVDHPGSEMVVTDLPKRRTLQTLTPLEHRF